MSGTGTGGTWENVKRRYPIGSVVEGTVVKVAPFGVFVDLGVGFEGLLLVPEMAGDTRKQIKDYPQVGQRVAATVIWHNDPKQQFSLSQRAKYTPG
jgi:small subunit ribosomal protein S1